MTGVLDGLVIQAVIAVTGLVVSIGIPILLKKFDTIEKLDRTVHGREGTDGSEGLFGVVRSLNSKIDGIREDIRDVKESQRDMQRRLDGIDDYIEYRRHEDPMDEEQDDDS